MVLQHFFKQNSKWQMGRVTVTVTATLANFLYNFEGQKVHSLLSLVNKQSSLKRHFQTQARNLFVMWRILMTNLNPLRNLCALMWNARLCEFLLKSHFTFRVKRANHLFIYSRIWIFISGIILKKYYFVDWFVIRETIYGAIIITDLKYLIEIKLWQTVSIDFVLSPFKSENSCLWELQIWLLRLVYYSALTWWI